MPRYGVPFTINIGGNTRGLRRSLGHARQDLRRFNTDIERIGLSGAQKLRQYVNRHSRQVVAGVGVAVGGAAAAATAATVATLSSADEAQQRYRRATGATARDADAQWRAVLRTLGRVPDQLDTVADSQGALRTLVSGTNEDISRLTEGVLDYVRVAGGDGVTTADALGRALKAFGLDAAAGRQELDVLTAVSQDYGIAGGELVQLLQTFGPVLHLAGMGFGEAATFVGQLYKGGVNLTRVAPGINAFLRRTAADGIDAGRALEYAFAEIRDATTDVAALATATGFFGAEGAARLTSAIRSGAVDLQLAGEFVDSAAGRLASEIDGTATASERIAETWNGIQASMINDLLPDFQRLVSDIAEAAPEIARHASTLARFVGGSLDIGLGGVLHSGLQEILTLGRSQTPLDEATSLRYAAAEGQVAAFAVSEQASAAGIAGTDLEYITELAREVGILRAFSRDTAGFASYYGPDFSRDFPNDAPNTISQYTTDSADAQQRYIDRLIAEAEAAQFAAETNRVHREGLLETSDALASTDRHADTLAARIDELRRQEALAAFTAIDATDARRSLNRELARSIQLVIEQKAQLFSLDAQQRETGGGGRPADARTLALEQSAADLLLAREEALELVEGNAIGRELDEFDQQTISAVQAWFQAVADRTEALRDRGQGGLVATLIGDERDNLAELRRQGAITADTYSHLLGELDQIAAGEGQYSRGGGGGIGVDLELPTDAELREIISELNRRVADLPAPVAIGIATALEDIPDSQITGLIAAAQMQFGAEGNEIVASVVLSALALSGMTEQITGWATSARAALAAELPVIFGAGLTPHGGGSDEGADATVTVQVDLYSRDPEGLLPLISEGPATGGHPGGTDAEGAAPRLDVAAVFASADPEGLLPLIRSYGEDIPTSATFYSVDDEELLPIVRSGGIDLPIEVNFYGNDPEGLLPLVRGGSLNVPITFDDGGHPGGRDDERPPAGGDHPLAVLGDGGIVTGPTLALIGEAGPEAVVPLDGRSGPLGDTYYVVNVTVHGSIIRERELAELIDRQLNSRRRTVGTVT